MLKPIATTLLATTVFGSVAYTDAASPLTAEQSWASEPEIVIPERIEKLSSTDYMEVRELAVNGGPFAKHNAFVYVYENPEELREFIPEAVEFLRAAAEAGVPDAQYNLGFLHKNGEWVPKDLDTALNWLEASAKTGHVRAQMWSGLTYLGLYYAASEGPEANRLLACGEHWLRNLIKMDDHCDECLVARTSLGNALISRSLVDPEGWKLLKHAATAGHARAIRSLFLHEKMLLEFESSGYEHAPALLAELQPFLKTLVESNAEPLDTPDR